MDLLEIVLIVSAIVALYNLQQIKMILKDKGYTVDPFTGWVKDYRRFRDLIQKETNETAKIKYQKIINGLFLSLGGLIFFAVMMLRERL